MSSLFVIKVRIQFNYRGEVNVMQTKHDMSYSVSIGFVQHGHAKSFLAYNDV